MSEDFTWSVKYEFSTGPAWLMFWFGAWVFTTTKENRSKFKTKTQARKALRQFQNTWYRPVGQTNRYVLSKTWKCGKRPKKRTVKIQSLNVDKDPVHISGPWDKEDSECIWTSKVSGLNMMVVRSESGYLCGYVEVPKSNYLHGVKDELMNVHGGITFCGRLHEFFNVSEDSWWFGFHAGHCTDIIPSNPVRVFWDSEYRNFKYMKENCEKLGEQIKRYDAFPEKIR